MKTEDQKENPTDESQNSTAKVDKSRRAFAKAGAAAPVIMTMASRPVFGAVECASAMVSTTHASHSPLAECWGGMSPGFWKTPNGKLKINGVSTGVVALAAWRSALHVTSDADAYGSLSNTNKPNRWNSYAGGAQVCPFTDGTRPIREVLNDSGNGSLHNMIAVWLNVLYADANNINYVLTLGDFNNIALGGSISSTLLQTLQDSFE
jgi:hypothetical protein